MSRRTPWIDDDGWEHGRPKAGVVACTCTPTDAGHEWSCRGSEAVLAALGEIGYVGAAGGALTQTERSLIQAVEDLIRDRLGLRLAGLEQGKSSVSMADVAVWLINNAAECIPEEVAARAAEEKKRPRGRPKKGATS